MNKEFIHCETQEGRMVRIRKERLKFRVSAYGILVKENKILVIQAHLPLWEFPGGGTQLGEPIVDCLSREFREESGLEITTTRLLLERESFYFSPSQKVYHSFQHFFVVNQVGGELVKSATWVDIDQLNEKNMNLGAYAALQAYLCQSESHEFLPHKFTSPW